MNKSFFTSALVCLACSATLVTPVSAQELEATLKKVVEHAQKEQFSKALQELSWAEKELQQAHSKKLQALFPEKLGSYTGQKFDGANALGMISLERRYADSEGKEVTVTLLGGSGDAQNPLAGVAALSQMAAMMGEWHPV